MIRDFEGNEVKIELNEFSLIDAWKSEKLEKIRKAHKNNKRTFIDPGCRNCHHGHVKSGYTKIPESWNVDNMQWKEHSNLSEKRNYKKRGNSG